MSWRGEQRNIVNRPLCCTSVDRDDKGEKIAKAAERNGHEWCAVDFQFIICAV